MWKKVNCYLPYEKTGFPGKQLKPCSGLPYRRSQVYRCPDKTSPDRRRSMCLILTCRVYALHCHAVYGFGRDNKAALGEVSVIMSSCPHRHYCHVLDPNMSSCACHHVLTYHACTCMCDSTRKSHIHLGLSLTPSPVDRFPAPVVRVCDPSARKKTIPTLSAERIFGGTGLSNSKQDFGLSDLR